MRHPQLHTPLDGSELREAIRHVDAQQPATSIKPLVRQGLSLVGLGLALGVAAALVLTRLMSTLLYEVPANDPLTFAVVISTLVVVAGIASVAPARRATGISPRAALRST